MAELSARGYECLRDAVTVAKEMQVKTVRALRLHLHERGFDDREIDEALDTWAGSVVIRLLPQDN